METDKYIELLNKLTEEEIIYIDTLQDKIKNINDYRKNYYQNNKDKIKSYQKEYYNNNKEEKKKKMLERYYKIKEKEKNNVDNNING
jgi:hypothetical protein